MAIRYDILGALNKEGAMTLDNLIDQTSLERKRLHDNLRSAIEDGLIERIRDDVTGLPAYVITKLGKARLSGSKFSVNGKNGDENKAACEAEKPKEDACIAELTDVAARLQEENARLRTEYAADVKELKSRIDVYARENARLQVRVTDLESTACLPYASDSDVEERMKELSEQVKLLTINNEYLVANQAKPKGYIAQVYFGGFHATQEEALDDARAKLKSTGAGDIKVVVSAVLHVGHNEVQQSWA